jgi:O-antigen ligase
VVWLRQEFRWAEIEPEQGRYDWSASDRIVAAAAARDFRLVAVLTTSPAWARDAQSASAPPRDPATFAAFAGAFARRYGDTLDHYQIWELPNIAAGWGDQPAVPEAYGLLLRQAAGALRAADPQAVVLLGALEPAALQPGDLDEVLYLRRLYETGAAPHFDVAAVQAFAFTGGPDDRRVDPGVLNFSQLLLVREEMVRQGDAGTALWASAFGWSAPGAGAATTSERPWEPVDAGDQAANTAEAIARARLEWPWAGVLFYAAYEAWGEPDPLASFALVGPDGQPRPVLAALSDSLGAPPLAWPGWHPAAPAPFAEYAGEWRFGELGADVSEPAPGEPPERALLQFYGTDLGLTIRRGPYRAHLYVTVDGQPANALPRDQQGAYLILTAPDGAVGVETVAVARGLADGPHVLELEVQRGWGQWPLVGYSVGRVPPGELPAGAQAGVLAAAGLALAGAVVFGWRAGWPAALQAARRRFTARSTVLQAALTGLVAVLFYGTAWLTWSENLLNVGRPLLERLGAGGQVALVAAVAGGFYYSPWLPLTLAALLALAVLIFFRLDLGLALAVFCAPFYLLPRPLFERSFAMTGIVIWLCALAWLLDAARRWRRGERALGPAGGLQPLDGAVALFLLVATLSLGVAEFQREALREYRTVVLEPVVLYALIRLARLDRAGLWRLVHALVLSAVVVALIGLGQYVAGINLITAEGGVMRLRSVFGSPDNVGLYLGRVIPLALAVVLAARGGAIGRGRRRGYLAALVVLGLAVALSLSRGALLLGIPAGVAVVLLGWDRRRGLLALGALALVGAVVVGLVATDPRFAQRFDPAGETTRRRLDLWASSVDMLADHPWLGVGLDNFLYAYRGHYIRPEAWQEPDLSHPHNVVLDYATRLGLLGLGAGLLLQAAFWRTALRAWRALRAGAPGPDPLIGQHLVPDPAGAALALGLMGSMADFLAHGLVDNSYFLIDLAVVFMLTLATVANLQAARAHARVGERALRAVQVTPGERDPALVRVGSG